MSVLKIITIMLFLNIENNCQQGNVLTKMKSISNHPMSMRNIHQTLKECIINSNRCAACTYVVLPPSLAVTSVSRGLRNCGGMSRVVLYWSCVSSTTESTWSGVKVKVWVTEVSVTDVSVWVRLCVSSSGMATKSNGYT